MAEQLEKTKINYGKMSVGVMSKALTTLGVKAPPKTAVGMAAALRKLFTAKVEDKEDLLDCTNCGGSSTADYPICPYCGDQEIVDATQVLEASGETVSETVEPSPKPKKAPKAAAAPAAPKLTALQGGKAAKAPKAPRVAGAAPALALDPVVELDAAVARVLDFKARTAESMWDLGHEIRIIYEQNLWMRRLRPDGEKLYTQFNKFCEDELGMSKTTAYALMDVSAAFSKDQIRAYGLQKLKLVLQLPEAIRQQLLNEDREKPGTVGDMREKVAALGGEGAAGDGDDEQLGSELADEAAAAADRNSNADTEPVTAVVRISREPLVLTMLKSNPGKGKKRPAAAIADDPWCELELENGVVQRFSVRLNPDKQLLELRIETRRA